MSAEVAKDVNVSDKEAVKMAVKNQVEFYFSRENLANDSFLISQMNSQMFVSIEVISNFSKIKQLTDDASLIVEAVKDSKVCLLNPEGNAIKPNVKSERNTIILREIPSGTTSDEVKAIFADCGAVSSVRSDVGDTWFVTMETEGDAVNTLLKLRNKTFNGNAIKARLKSENPLRSLYPSGGQKNESPLQSVPANYGANGGGYYNNMASMYGVVPNNYGVQYNNAGSVGGLYGNANYGAGVVQDGNRNGSTRGGHVSRNSFRNSKHKDSNGRNGVKGADQKGNLGKKHKDKQRNGHSSSKKSQSIDRQPILSSSNFPPLPSNGEERNDSNSCNDQIKYSYSHDDIMEIVKHMSEEDCKFSKDKEMDYLAHAAALTATAHPDLLRNQRTYSIDQAREAMRQGRPIRSDSVGSVDYESMMYGEDYTKVAREIRSKQTSKNALKSNSPAKDPTASTGLPNGTTVESVPVTVSTAPINECTKASEPQMEPQPKKSGYAAALINGAAAAPPAPSTPQRTPKKNSSIPNSAAKDDKKVLSTRKKKNGKKNSVKKDSDSSNAASAPPSESLWGGKKSFRDVLKTQSDSPDNSAASTPQKVCEKENDMVAVKKE